MNRVEYTPKITETKLKGTYWMDGDGDIFLLYVATHRTPLYTMVRLKDGAFHEISDHSTIGSAGYEQFHGSIAIDTEVLK